jgi:CubicO group peptidase (beta-lactamase class C family)
MHTAGLTTFNPARQLAIDEMIRRYGVVFWPPGERFDYSNLGPIVLEEIIARASGQRYPDFLRDEVLRPLGLTRTSVGVDPDLERHAAKRYDWAGGFAPHSRTGVYSSAHDLVRFGMFHLKARLPGQRGILSDAAIDAMQNSTVAAGDRRYGLSWWVDEDPYGYPSVFNQGGTTWDLAWLKLIPSEGVAAAVLLNKGNSGPAREVIEEVIAAVLPAYGERRAQAPPEVPPQRPSEAVPPEVYVGWWRGVVKTHRGDVPLALSVDASGETRVKLGAQPEQSLGGARFNPVRLSGRIDGDLGVEDDMGEARYDIGLLLFLRGDALQGPAVTGPGAQLPFWTELKREAR